MYCPVRNEARAGEHNDVVTNALVNRMPPLAKASMWGVSTKGCPMNPKVSYRRSSTSTKTMFGRGAFSETAIPPLMRATYKTTQRTDGCFKGLVLEDQVWEMWMLFLPKFIRGEHLLVADVQSSARDDGVCPAGASLAFQFNSPVLAVRFRRGFHKGQLLTFA